MIHSSTYRSAFALLLTTTAIAAHAYTGVNNVSTTLSGGDRTLNSLGFVGSGTVFNGANIAQFHDGKLVNNVGTFGWNDPIARDMDTSGNAYSSNPDRTADSTAFAGEASHTGTLKEVFGGNNLSWIMDGEDSGSWSLDLYFGAGKFVVDDGNSSTMELAILERGGNSDLGVRAIYDTGNGGMAYSSGIVLNRAQGTSAGFSIQTLEIGDSQAVKGWGVSLNELGQVGGNIIGYNLYSQSDFNGPDIMGVTSAQAVPEPGTMIALASGVAALLSRKRAKGIKLKASTAESFEQDR